MAASLPTIAWAQEEEQPFGSEFPKLDGLATGKWWEKSVQEEKRQNPKRFVEMNVPRDEVVAFAVYTVSKGTLKLSAQLFPLMPDESRDVRLRPRGLMVAEP